MTKGWFLIKIPAKYPYKWGKHDKGPGYDPTVP